ncbi:hypothetical protein [Glaciibacter sp. 2TAF33]|uniref:hypothetical protein n=1 Tax=Glaciibacter sp. 2TAF33 TaxID=3233015 RepID=UPI003F8EA057
MSEESEQCKAFVDVIYGRKRHASQQCHAAADHISSTFAVTAQHVTSVLGYPVWWKDSQAKFNRNVGRFEVRA